MKCKGTTFSRSAKGFRRKNKPDFNPPIGIFYRPNWHSCTQNKGKKAICQRSFGFLCLFHRKPAYLVPPSCTKENDELQGRKRRIPPRKTMSYDQELISHTKHFCLLRKDSTFICPELKKIRYFAKSNPIVQQKNLLHHEILSIFSARCGNATRFGYYGSD